MFMAEITVVLTSSLLQCPMPDSLERLQDVKLSRGRCNSNWDSFSHFIKYISKYIMWRVTHYFGILLNKEFFKDQNFFYMPWDFLCKLKTILKSVLRCAILLCLCYIWEYVGYMLNVLKGMKHYANVFKSIFLKPTNLSYNKKGCQSNSSI
jgi:hypothetical protein